MDVTVVFKPSGLRATVPPGTSIMEAAWRAGEDVPSECGGRGTCGRCKVLILEGKATGSPTTSETRLLNPKELEEGYRLACQTQVEGDAVVEMPLATGERERKILTQGLERAFPLHPLVGKCHLSLPKDSLREGAKIVDQIVKAAAEEGVDVLGTDPGFLEHLPHSPLECGVTLTLWDGELISLEPGDTSRMLYGAALDIGTSKVVGHLVDLTDGSTLAVASVENPQEAHGDDIVSRMTFALKGSDNLERLHRLSLEAVNLTLEALISGSGVNPRGVYGVVVVGNTLMHHLFLGLEVDSLAKAPFRPAKVGIVCPKASELGVSIHPRGRLYLPPVIAGFVGSDALAGLLATGMYDSDEPSVFIDIGTNTEVFVGDRSGLVSCSCASGPAFEGGHISHGVKAVSGAIERMRIDPVTLGVEYETIGGEKPIGLCGSAMIDALAELWKSGVIDNLGLIDLETGSPRVRKADRGGEFVVEWGGATAKGTDITITSGDIQELLLAKAAVYAACSVMMRRRRLGVDDISRFYVAGAFGENLDPANVAVIGMLPDVKPDRILFVGNTAVTGAKAMLVSKEAREIAEGLLGTIRYHELSLDPDFDTEFLNAVFLPHKEAERFPTVTRLRRHRKG